jgi:hypothetical protein
MLRLMGYSFCIRPFDVNKKYCQLRGFLKFICKMSKNQVFPALCLITRRGYAPKPPEENPGGSGIVRDG